MAGIYTDIVQYKPFYIRNASGMNFRCCDCGLVHGWRIRPKKGGWVELTMWRNNRATANTRRGKRRPQRRKRV